MWNFIAAINHCYLLYDDPVNSLVEAELRSAICRGPGESSVKALESVV